jgi:lipoprotein NlpI
MRISSTIGATIVSQRTVFESWDVSCVVAGCRGYAFRKLGQWDKAISDYTQSLRLAPDSIKTHNNLGYSYAKSGNFDAAVRNYSTVRVVACVKALAKWC